MRLTGAVRDELERVVRELTPLEDVHAERFSAEGADLRSICLSGSRLERGKLSGANLEGSRMSACHLTDVLLDQARLANAFLSDSSFEHVDFTGVRFDAAQVRDDAFARCSFDRSTWDRALVVGCRWHACDLSGASLRQAVIISSELAHLRSAASLRGADLSGACLIDVDLRNADLRGARFEGALLCNVDLRGARLEEALWDEATLVQVQAAGAEGALPRAALAGEPVPVSTTRSGARKAAEAPGWLSGPTEAAVWRYLQAAPSETAARLALELCRRLRLAPNVIEHPAGAAAMQVEEALDGSSTDDVGAPEHAGGPGGVSQQGAGENRAGKPRAVLNVSPGVRLSVRGA